MKKLVLPALLIGLIQSTGCGPIDGDMDVVWQFTAGIDDDQAGSCADFGGDLVEVTIVDLFDGAETVDAFPCEDGGVVFLGLPDSDFDVSLTFFDSAGVEAAVVEPQTDVPVVAGAVTEVDFVLASDGGYLGFQWELEEVDAVGTTVGPLSCDEVNATGVQFEVNSLDDPSLSAEYVFPCSELEVFGEGKLFFGLFDINIDLVDAQDNILTLESVQRLGVEVTVANEITDLGAAIFEFVLP